MPTFAPLTTLYAGSSAYSSMLPPASGGADYLNLHEREGSKFLTLARFQFDDPVRNFLFTSPFTAVGSSAAPAALPRATWA